jgi:excisionase family DNA binding protein
MLTPAGSDAKELVNLAERMGISTEDAIYRVVMRIVDRQLSQDVVRAQRGSPRRRPFAGADGRRARKLHRRSASGGRMEMNKPKDQLLTLSEVATIFQVDPKTVTRWAKDGKLNSIRTLGGERRFMASEVRRMFQEGNIEHK